MSKENRILAAMFISMALGYMPWYNFSAVLKYISQEFHLTATDTGLILSAFQAGYVVIVMSTGWLADRISLKKILFWATLLTGISSLLFIWVSQGKLSILVMRLIVGLSAGAIYVPGMMLLSRWFPASRRGTALGAYTSALVAAYAGGYLIGSHLSVAYGWRSGILWTSLPAILAAFVILVFVEDKPLEEAAVCKVSPQTGVAPSSAQCCPAGGYAGPTLITAGYVGHMWELYAFWGWIGPFLIATQLANGVPTAQAVSTGGTLTAAIILLGVPSSWLWGWMADKKGRSFAMAVGGTFSVVGEFFLGSLFGYSFAFVVIVAGWIGFWVISDSALYKAGLLEMMDPKFTGLALGIQSAVGFGITIISPAVFGAVLQLYNGAGNPTSATQWWPSFGVLGVGGLLAPIAILLLRRMPQAVLMAGGKR